MIEKVRSRFSPALLVYLIAGFYFFYCAISIVVLV